MKKCENATKCQYGSCIEREYCGLEGQDEEMCPKMVEEMQMFEYYIVHGGGLYE